MYHSRKRAVLKCKSDHFTLKFRTLQWFLISLRIKSRILAAVFNASCVLAASLTFLSVLPALKLFPVPGEAEPVPTTLSLCLLFPLPGVL